MQERQKENLKASEILASCVLFPATLSVWLLLGVIIPCLILYLLTGVDVLTVHVQPVLKGLLGL